MREKSSPVTGLRFLIWKMGVGTGAFGELVLRSKFSRFRIDRFLGNTLLYPSILILNHSVVFTGILPNLHNCKDDVVSPLVKNRYAPWHRWNE